MVKINSIWLLSQSLIIIFAVWHNLLEGRWHAFNLSLTSVLEVGKLWSLSWSIPCPVWPVKPHWGPSGTWRWYSAWRVVEGILPAPLSHRPCRQRGLLYLTAWSAKSGEVSAKAGKRRSLGTREGTIRAPCTRWDTVYPPLHRPGTGCPIGAVFCLGRVSLVWRWGCGLREEG